MNKKMRKDVLPEGFGELALSLGFDAENQALLLQARERAMEIIEQYIISTGELVDKTYTVRWVEE